MATLKYRDSSGAWQTLDYGKAPSWTDITGKPTVFSPAEHQHAQSDVNNLEYALSSKIDKYVAPFSKVTYKGNVYTSWKFLDKTDITLALTVNGADVDVARFFKDTGKFMMSLSTTLLFDGLPGSMETGPHLQLSGMTDGVKHSDFEDVEADLTTSKSSISDVMEKVNTLISILKGSAVVAALILSPLMSYSAVDVLNIKLSNLYESNPSKTYVVTNITGAAAQSDLVKKQDKLPYPTNAIPYTVLTGTPDLSDMATKTWTDKQKQDKLPYPTNAIPYTAIKGRPDTSDMATKTWVNNQEFADKDWVLEKNYVTENITNGLVTSCITNGLASVSYVDAHTPGNYAEVSNKAMTAVQDISGKQNTLIAGDHINITEDNVISVVSGICDPWDLILTESESIPGNTYRAALTLVSVSSATNVQIGIGDKTFAYLPSLKTVNIGCLTSIAPNAFLNVALATLAISNSPAAIGWVGSNGFAGAKFTTAYLGPVTNITRTSCESTGVKVLYMPNLEELPPSIFEDHPTLQVFGDSESCVEISDNAFASCSSLLSVGSMKKCMKIGDYSFDGCISLESLGVMANCSSVGRRTFQDCYLLGTVCLGNVTNLGERAFSVMGRDVSTIRLLVKNVASEFKQTFSDSSGEIAYFPHSGTIYCQDGYLKYSGSEWVIYSYTTTKDLPSPGFAEYVYTIGTGYYRWSGSYYDKTYLIGTAVKAADGSLVIEVPSSASGTVTLKYVGSDRNDLKTWVDVGTCTW